MMNQGSKYFNYRSGRTSIGDAMKTPTPILTTTAGNPVADNQNSLSAGPRGPLLMQDYQLLEKLAHQNRERIMRPFSMLDVNSTAERIGSPGNRTYPLSGEIFRVDSAGAVTLVNERVGREMARYIDRMEMAL